MTEPNEATRPTDDDQTQGNVSDTDEPKREFDPLVADKVARFLDE